VVESYVVEIIPLAVVRPNTVLQKYQFFRVAIKPWGTILGTKKTGRKIESKADFMRVLERYNAATIRIAVVRPRSPGAVADPAIQDEYYVPGF
jgi:hypothetical protein